MSTTNYVDSFLELIPESQLDPKVPKIVKDGNVTLPTYKFRRVPRLEELQQLIGLMPIRQAQSEFLAQIPYPISINLDEDSFGSFSDGGYAFVDALRRRDSSFGNLTLSQIMDSHEDVFERLLQVKTIDTLEIRYSLVSPRRTQQLLSAAAKGVKFKIRVEDMAGLDWPTVAILPKELTLTCWCFNSARSHLNPALDFLRRVAELGYFVKLDLDLLLVDRAKDSFTKELIHAVDSNQSLSELRLRRTVTHYEGLFTMMGHHKGLRRFTLREYPVWVDPDYSMLKRLLKRNRFIEVFDDDGGLVTDGDEIDRLYAINRFFRGLQDLAAEPLSMLPPLVCEALVHGACSDFQRSALLIASHTDALCELVQYSVYNAEETSSTSLISNAGFSSLPLEDGNE